MKTQTESHGNWLIDLIMKLRPDTEPLKPCDTLENMISGASWKAFAVSTAASIPPGPVGMLTILPEVIAVTRIQLGLIGKIAKYYEKEKELNGTVIALILGNAAGIATGRELLKCVDNKIIIQRMSTLALQNFAARIGAKILGRIVARMPARWIPLVTAPLFGMMSKTATARVGWEVVALFSQGFKFTDEDERYNA